MSQGVMIIGVDGAPWALLSHWISTNKLPTFKRITNLGLKGILKSTIPCTTFPALPSMFTGMNPGNLGIFSFINFDGSLATMKEIQYPKIWNILDKHNRSSCIVNVPATFPPEKVNGVMISGWAPSEKSNYTYPGYIKKDIKGFRNDRIEEEIRRLRKKKRNEKSREKYFDLMIEQTERRYDIFKKLNQEKDYDFSIFWIQETDIIQHYCWEYKESLLRFYIKVDNILSDVLSNFPERNLFVVSDHGFESRPEKFFFVNTWLRKQGYLKQMGGPIINHFVNFGEFFAYNYLHRWFLEKILVLRESMKKKSGSNQKCAISKIDNIPGIDKKHSKAYLSTIFGIRVNNASNYEAIREEIIKKLRKLKDEKGGRVIRGCWRKEEVFTGKYLKEIPDIIFFTSERYTPFPALTKNLFAKVKRIRYWWQSGEHFRARDGILMACGPAIKKNNDLVNANIEDVFPTILHLMGFEIPRYVDGKVLTKVSVRVREPVFKEYKHVTEEIKLERKDEEKIIDRLRELGYL